MGEALTVHQVREMLFRTCETAGSQKAWAEHFGISGSYVSDVLKGRRDPGDGILVALGLRKIVTYERFPAPEPPPKDENVMPGGVYLELEP